MACSSCHSHAREDVEAYLLLPKNELCISCHKMDCGCAGKGVIHQSQAEMFRGVEGRGALGIPSKHFGQMQGSCTPCHMYRPPEAGEAVLTEGGHTFDAPVSACLPCHQGGAEALVAQRRSEVESLLAQVEEALGAVPSELQGSPLYQDAKHNLDMVHGDGGWGLHNPTYAKALLEAALEMLQALPTEER
ncbi:MAG: hypothetical protein KatS3mg115_2116 [Candidatus Poribacteria bacterium]|nr:MAG: hypothetical protein KatS3mg115_2116 [Candidatus Poribacteria bacterium]